MLALALELVLNLLLLAVLPCGSRDEIDIEEKEASSAVVVLGLSLSGERSDPGDLRLAAFAEA